VSILLVCGCADPRPPTGGPRDEVPPAIVSTEPPNESVNISPDQIKMSFSEYVNEGSFGRALSIVPTPLGRLNFRWRGKSVTIRLPEQLLDSTTYVVTLNDEFRDWHGVRLKRPLSFAFSTGPVIDQGRLRGRIIDHQKGIPVAGLMVLAYPVNSSLDESPSYQTQTDTEGKFEFSYVRESSFFVIGLRDLNRNLRPDPLEWYAVPPFPMIRATPDTTAPTPDWIYTHLDTLRPRIERIRAPTNQRLDLRFNENISLSTLSGDFWTLTDSLTNTPVQVHSSYQLASNPRSVYLIVDPLQETTYSLITTAAVQDSSGNTNRSDTTYFMGSLSETNRIPTFVEFLTTNEESPYRLAPWENPKIVFDQSIERPLLDSLVSVKDSTGALVPFEVESSNGTIYSLTNLSESSQVYHISVLQPDSIHVRYFERLGPRSLGSVSGITVPFGDSVRVILTDTDRKFLSMQTPDSLGRFLFPQLPEQTYHLYAFIDQNLNDQWDGGRIYPYHRSEPITWSSNGVTIRPRWDTELPDTLKLGQTATSTLPTTDQ